MELAPFPNHVTARNKAWWDVKSKEYPFHAEAPTSTKPHVVDAALEVDIVSVPLRIGWRIYGFTTKEARDRFCNTFNAREVSND